MANSASGSRKGSQMFSVSKILLYLFYQPCIFQSLSWNLSDGKFALFLVMFLTNSPCCTKRCSPDLDFFRLLLSTLEYAALSRNFLNCVWSLLWTVLMYPISFNFVKLFIYRIYLFLTLYVCHVVPYFLLIFVSLISTAWNPTSDFYLFNTPLQRWLVGSDGLVTVCDNDRSDRLLWDVIL